MAKTCGDLRNRMYPKLEKNAVSNINLKSGSYEPRSTDSAGKGGRGSESPGSQKGSGPTEQESMSQGGGRGDQDLDER